MVDVGRTPNALPDGLLLPPDSGSLPRFEAGRWSYSGGSDRPFVSYLASESVGWSEELQGLHDDGPDHVIDRGTRAAALLALASEQLGGRATIADIGCGSGRMLEDIAREFGGATLVGIDAVPVGLSRAHERVPRALLVLADVRALPLTSGSLDAVVALNVLEHVPEDRAVLQQIRRVLRPGGVAVLVVPFNQRLYDFYDRLLEHERRYARRELARKAEAAGLHVTRDTFVGCLAYPAFWLVKKWNRARYHDPPAARAEELVRRRIVSSDSSFLGGITMTLDRGLLRAGVPGPFGIRELLVVQAR